MRREVSKDIIEKINLGRKNKLLICGIDEVGRGPLAGPVVACAVIMPEDKIEGINDSKKLSEKKRIRLDKEIREKALALGIGQCDNNIIDEVNIKNATHLAMEEALNNLRDKNGKRIEADLVLIDNETINTRYNQLSVVHGDELIYEISCASIVAKVYRDNQMIEYSKEYPYYSFETNKGYGTKKHYEGLDEHGISPIHRKTFLKKYFNS